MKKITPYLWYNDNAEEAMNYYLSIFNNSKAGNVDRLPDGKTSSVTFQLEGQDFIAINGGPHFQFNEAVSMFVNCNDQQEVDYYWNALTADGGEESMCGWLKDKYGLSWQIVPSVLMELIGHKEREKASRAMNAMLQMKKIVIADLQKAFDGH